MAILVNLNTYVVGLDMFRGSIFDKFLLRAGFVTSGKRIMPQKCEIKITLIVKCFVFNTSKERCLCLSLSSLRNKP